MRFNCGESPAARAARRDEASLAEVIRLRNWHHWFAWYPVRVGENDCRWLETVWRKMHYAYRHHGSVFGVSPVEYRALNSNEEVK